MSDAERGLLRISVRRSVARPEVSPWTHQLVRPFGLLSVKGSSGGERPWGSLRCPGPPPILLCDQYSEDRRRHGADRSSSTQALVMSLWGLTSLRKVLFSLKEY